MCAGKDGPADCPSRVCANGVPSVTPVTKGATFGRDRYCAAAATEGR